MPAHGVVNPRVGSPFRKLPAGSMTRWPGGPRMLLCLGCERSFKSQGRGNRLCYHCHADIADDVPVNVGLHVRAKGRAG